MHNFNLTTVPTASQNVTNLSILEESCNNNSYSYWFGANDLFDSGAARFATFVTGTSSVPAHWLLVNANSSGIGAYIRRHQDWKYGSFDFKVHWSSSASSGNVVFYATAEPTTALSAFPSATNCSFTVAAGTADIPQVDTLMSASLRQESLIERSKMGIYVRLSRIGGDAADTNAGDIAIYGIELVYNEAKRVIGDAIKK